MGKAMIVLAAVWALLSGCAADSNGDGAIGTVAPALTQAAGTPIRAPATATVRDPSAVVATPRPSPEATPAVDFRFSAITQDDQALVRAGIDIASRYLRATTGERAANVVVYASGNLGTLARQFASTPAALEPSAAAFSRRIGFGMAEAHPAAVFVFTGAELWRTSNAVQRVRAVVHEYMHVFQFQAMGAEMTRQALTAPSTQPRPEGPSWLFEGIADLLSWRAIEAAGLTSVTDQLGIQRSRVKDAGLSPRRMESYLDYLGSGPDAIGLSLLAADLLVGDNEASAVQYFDDLRPEIPWQATFAATFARTPAQFYEEWDAYEAAGFTR